MTLLPFGWSQYLIGGLAIGTGVALLYVFTGLVGGMSSVYSTTWSFVVDSPFFRQSKFLTSRRWRLTYALGLMVGAFVWVTVFNHGQRVAVTVPHWQLFVGGLIGGYGARLSGGCTSGHGICGLASLKLPSLAAVLTFMATAFLTAQLCAKFLA